MANINLETNHEFWKAVQKEIGWAAKTFNSEQIYKYYSGIVRNLYGIKSLRGEIKESVQEQLFQLIPNCSAKRLKRFRNRNYLTQERREGLYRANLKQKLQKRKAELLQSIQTLFQRNYRKPESGWAGGETHFDLSFSDIPKANISAYKVWSQNGKWSGNNLRVDFTVMRSWRKEVLDAGLAVVGGMLTTHVEQIEPDLWKASWLQQSRGMSVVSKQGYIYHRDGEYFHGSTPTGCKATATRFFKQEEVKKALALEVSVENLPELIKAYPDIKLYRQTSLKSGNCLEGTQDWIEKFGFSDRSFITVAEAYQADGKNNRVQNVILLAIAKFLKG